LAKAINRKNTKEVGLKDVKRLIN